MQLLGFPGIVIQRPNVTMSSMQMAPSAGVVSPPLQVGPPGDPSASTAPNTGGQGDNVVTMCPDGTTPTSIGCMGPNGVSTTANVVQTSPCPVGQIQVCPPNPYTGPGAEATFCPCMPDPSFALPTSFPWIQLGLGVIGGIIGGLVGRHYKHPALGAGIGGGAFLLGGTLALRDVSFSVGG